MTTKQEIEQLKKFIGKPIIFKTPYMEEDQLGYDEFFGNEVIVQSRTPILVDDIHTINGKKIPFDRYVDLEYAKENCLKTQIKITNILIKLFNYEEQETK